MKYDKLFELLGNKEKNNGITTYSLRANKQLGQSTMQRMRNCEPVRMEVICRLCFLLNCQPCDIMEYVPSDQDAIK